MRYILCALMSLWAVAATAAVQVSVRPLTVQEGQSVELILSSDKDKKDAPDWAPLLDNFRIGRQMYSKQTNIVNGQGRTSYQHILSLTPLSSGEVQVPSLTWGGEKTQPVVISVQPANSKDAQVFMTATADKTQLYVGQSVTYTARVYDKAGLSGGEFVPPQIEGGEVQKIGDPVASSQTKDGKWYQVYEQTYVLFAPKAGRMTIKPARFEGYVQTAQPQRRDLLSVFGMPDDVFYRGFLDQQREIFLKADPLTLEVLPQPTSYQGWWLPSASVKLQQTFTPSASVANLGDNITRQIVLTAQGVMPYQLPDVDMPEVPGFKIYPSEAQKTVSYNDKGLVSTLERTFVLVPIQNGELSIPPLSVPWFDVNTQQMKTATTEAHTVLIQGSLPPTSVETTPSAPVPATQAPIEPEVSAFAQENSWGWFIAGFCSALIVGALVGLLSVFMARKRKRLPDLYPH